MLSWHGTLVSIVHHMHQKRSSGSKSLPANFISLIELHCPWALLFIHVHSYKSHDCHHRSLSRVRGHSDSKGWFMSKLSPHKIEPWCAFCKNMSALEDWFTVASISLQMGSRCLKGPSSSHLILPRIRLSSFVITRVSGLPAFLFNDPVIFVPNGWPWETQWEIWSNESKFTRDFFLPRLMLSVIFGRVNNYFFFKISISKT